MQNKLKPSWLLTLLLLVSMFTACKKDKNPIVNNPTVTSSIFGRVVDENGNGVYGATAIAGGKTTTTDINGIFRISNATLDKNHASVKITKAGFFDGSRTFIASPAGLANVQIRLLTKTLGGTFSSTSGATISITADATVSFPANAIKRADGTIYTGTVNVYATYLDPTDANLSTKMPGDLLGIQTDNSERILQSFGMLNIELEDASGNKLNIADGKEATISTTVPVSLLATAPTSIPLWHFDTNIGLWKEEGYATLTGNKYIGNVKHFTWWYMAIPAGSTIELTMRLVDRTGAPVSRYTRLTSGGIVVVFDVTASGYDGRLYEYIQAGTGPYNLEYLDNCGNWIFIQTVGPYTTNTDLGNVTVTSPFDDITYTGNITNCSSSPVANGYVKYTIGINEYFTPTDAAGNFSFTVYTCSGASTVTITPYDMTTLQLGSSTTYTLPTTTATIALGTLVACGSIVDEYVKFQIDGGIMYDAFNPMVRSVDPSDPTSTTQYIIGGDSTTNTIRIMTDNITSTGVFAIHYMHYSSVDHSVAGIVYNASSASSIIHTATSYSASIGGYYEGTVTGSFIDDITNTSHTINCSYRIKRTQ